MIGYQVLFDDKFATVWSAPNYCYSIICLLLLYSNAIGVGNLASILEIDDSNGKFFNVFAACPQDHVNNSSTIDSYFTDDE